MRFNFVWCCTGTEVFNLIMKKTLPNSPMFRVMLFSIVALLAARLGATESAKPYNVLFVIIDDHGAGLTDVLRADSPVHTPNMSRLAARGTWFTNAYTNSPACCPSRTSFLTGVQATRSGVYYNGQAYRRAGAHVTGRIAIGPWVTLLLRRP